MRKYFRVVFWTRITNETDNPLELKMDFPADPYKLPSSPGGHLRILLPPDTMTIDKEPLYKTINPKESSGFYVVILFDNGVGGPFCGSINLKNLKL